MAISLSFMLIPTSIALWQQGFLDVNFHDVIVQNAILEVSSDWELLAQRSPQHFFISWLNRLAVCLLRW